jgi:hypothetical protein
VPRVVEEGVAGLDVGVEESGVVGAGGAAADLPGPHDGLLGRDSDAGGRGRLQRAVGRQDRDEVRLPEVEVGVPDREDVVVSEPCEDRGLAPHSGGAAGQELDRDAFLLVGVAPCRRL